MRLSGCARLSFLSRSVIPVLACLGLGGCASLPPALPQLSGSPGLVVSPSAEVFSERSAKRGYWKPAQFSRNGGGAKICFLEPYDPGRIPVLFIHGAVGSPRDWNYFFDRLDRRRYQPWFFYYPSGFPLDLNSDLLLSQLEELKARHGFQELYITAHSMGGLLARSLLVRHGSRLPFARLFVSISTPWGGDGLADFGVRHSPVVVPSWKDLRPQGPFLKALFDGRLPAGLDYYLFFGHRDRGLLRPNSDGTVTLRSQLAPQAQAEAQSVYGFDEDHTSILSSPEVLARYEAVLDATARKSRPVLIGQETVRKR